MKQLQRLQLPPHKIPNCKEKKGDFTGENGGRQPLGQGIKADRISHGTN